MTTHDSTLPTPRKKLDMRRFLDDWVMLLAAFAIFLLCTLLIDNFLSVPPEEMAQGFGAPVGFHIMFSKFIENDDAALDSMAIRLRRLIDLLKPLYVSDHIARFNHEGRQLYHLAEIDYITDYEQVRCRVDWWQQKLGCRLHLENYPSIMDGGVEAPAFLSAS